MTEPFLAGQDDIQTIIDKVEFGGEVRREEPISFKVDRAYRRMARAEKMRLSAESLLAEAGVQCRSGQGEAGAAEAAYLPWDAQRTITARMCLGASHAAVRVAVYSDEPVLTMGLSALIAADANLTLTACCGTLDELKALIASQSVDVAVVDFTEEITIAELNDLQRLNAECKLILWTHAIDGDMALRALQYGVRGVLRKSLPLEAHRRCLHQVGSGELWFERCVSLAVN